MGVHNFNKLIQFGNNFTESLRRMKIELFCQVYEASGDQAELIRARIFFTRLYVHMPANSTMSVFFLIYAHMPVLFNFVHKFIFLKIGSTWIFKMIHKCTKKYFKILINQKHY